MVIPVRELNPYDLSQRYLSTACSPGNSGWCDGWAENEGTCECFCHDALALDVPGTREGVREWHERYWREVVS